MDTVDFMGFENHGRNRRLQHAAQAQPLVAHGGDMVGIGLDEDDVVAGPHLAGMAKAAGVVYSLAYGDQPAIIEELFDWAERHLKDE